MYSNERHLRRNEIKVRFNDDDMDLIRKITTITRSQRAVLVREYTMREIHRLAAEGLPEAATIGRP